jgi:hypothetical protein
VIDSLWSGTCDGPHPEAHGKACHVAEEQHVHQVMLDSGPLAHPGEATVLREQYAARTTHRICTIRGQRLHAHAASSGFTRRTTTAIPVALRLSLKVWRVQRFRRMSIRSLNNSGRTTRSSCLLTCTALSATPATLPWIRSTCELQATPLFNVFESAGPPSSVWPTSQPSSSVYMLRASTTLLSPC